jgi:hypothetical protein
MSVRLLHVEFRDERETCRFRTARGLPLLKLRHCLCGRAAALRRMLEVARRGLNSSGRGGLPTLNHFYQGQPNKSLEMTAISAAVMRETPCLSRFVAASQFRR